MKFTTYAMLTRARALATRCLPVLALALCSQVHAQQAWPGKPVRIVVPFSVGGTTDLLARMVGQALSKNTGQSFIIDNRTGAGGSIGSAEVSRAAPDGYTLLLTTASTHSVAPVLNKLPYNTVTDFTPISHLADADLVILASPGLGIKNVAELLDLARKKPGALNYSTNGIGTISHLAFELLSVQTGISMVSVPYKGSGSAIADVSSGVVQMQMDVPATAITHINSGRVRAIATTGPRRSSMLPDVQTVAESVPGYASVSWFGIYGPRGMSPELTQRIHAAVSKVIESPEMLERLKSMGLEPGRGTAADFAAMVAADSARWGRVVKERNIKVD